MSVAFVPPRVPLVDVRTGTITREWYLLFQSFFSMGGGTPDDEIGLIAPIAPSMDMILQLLARASDDVALAPVQLQPATPADDLTPPTVPLFFSADDVLPVIGALRDEIAMLRALVDDMRKGTMVL